MPVLVIGATGTTGLRAIQGLLDVGYYQPNDLYIVTRNAQKPQVQQLQTLGFQIVQANLDDPPTLKDALNRLQSDYDNNNSILCYIHSTASDTAELDKKEVERAQNLCTALLEHHLDRNNNSNNQGSTRVVYNSAAGAKGHGVGRIQQKHDVEQVFAKTIQQHYRESKTKQAMDHFHFTALRANLFMEELWKMFTRPSILKGKYPLPVHRFRKVYLTSVRDMGRLAGNILQEAEEEDTSRYEAINIPSRKKYDPAKLLFLPLKCFQVINVAGDHLTGPQLAKAFAKAQGSPCRYYNNRDLTKQARGSFQELYEQIRFLQTSKSTTNISHLKKAFPGLISSFPAFLDETQWGNRSKTFDDFSDPQTLDFGVPRDEEAQIE